MKKIFQFFALLLFLGGNICQSIAQECDSYFPFEDDASFEMTSYNSDGKMQSYTKNRVIRKESITDGMEVEIQTDVYDKKDKMLTSGSYIMQCKSGTFYLDMSNLINKEQMEAYSNMDITVETASLELPSKIKAGQKLKDGSISLTVFSKEVEVGTMTIEVYNRKVEAKETITTPAGTFESYKITYDLNTKIEMGFPMSLKASAIEWFSVEKGLVIKNESYKQNGNLAGYTQLTALNE